MNANRRLEEFILKLSTRQNEYGQLDKINELKLTSYLNNLKLSEDNAYSRSSRSPKPPPS
jgi:hypothetical protein